MKPLQSLDKMEHSFFPEFHRLAEFTFRLVPGLSQRSAMRAIKASFPGDSMSSPDPALSQTSFPIISGVWGEMYNFSLTLQTVCLVEWKHSSGPQTTFSRGTVFTIYTEGYLRRCYMYGEGPGTCGFPERQDLRHFKQILHLTRAQNWVFVEGEYKKGKVFLGL